MEPDTKALTEREKETLRLLLAGHDAKSIAREFNLSVHTINDRLREARRKLQASSSREAARILAQQEAAPNLVAPQEIGIAEKLERVQLNGQPGGPERNSFVIAWLGGGLLVLILVFAALAFSVNGSGHGVIQACRTKPDADERRAGTASQCCLSKGMACADRCPELE